MIRKSALIALAACAALMVSIGPAQQANAATKSDLKVQIVIEYNSGIDSVPANNTSCIPVAVQ